MKRFFAKNLRRSFTRDRLRSVRGKVVSLLLSSILTVLSLLVGTHLTGEVGHGNAASALAPLLVAGTSLQSGSGDQIQHAKHKQHPQSGWIYVLDSNRMGLESQVLLVDPDQGRVVRTIKTGYNPDMALSPDGTRLYIASSRQRQTPDGPRLRGYLEVIDSVTGDVLQTVDNPDRAQPTHWEYNSYMAVSPDGNWLYMFKHIDAKEEDVYYVATFDTKQDRFLPGKASLPNCITALLFPLPQRLRIDVLCTGSKDVRFLKLTRVGAASSSRMELRGAPKTPGEYIGLGFLSTAANTFTAILGDGHFFEIDGESHELIRSEAIDSEARKISAMSPSDTRDDWLADSWIRLQVPPLSPDGERLYVGIGRLAHIRQGGWSFDRVAILDSHTLKREGEMKPSQPFWSFAMNHNANRLYAISPQQGSIMVMDTISQREIRTIYGIGTTPIFAIVAP